MNNSFGVANDWESLSSGNTNLTQNDFLSFPALLQLLDLPQDEGLFISKLHGDINMDKLVAMAAAKLKLAHPVQLPTDMNFICSVKTVLVDKNEQGTETETEELWSSRLSVASDSPNHGLTWKAEGENLPLGVTLEESASYDARWRLVFEFFETDTLPSPNATLVSVAHEVDSSTHDEEKKKKKEDEESEDAEPPTEGSTSAQSPDKSAQGPKVAYFAQNDRSLTKSL